MTRSEFIKSGLLISAAGSIPAAVARTSSPGQPFQRWERRTLILGPGGADAWDENPTAPHVMVVDGKLRMYYEGRQPFVMPNGRREYFNRIGTAEASLDQPHVWKKNPQNPVFGLGPAGAIDSHWAAYPWIVRVTESHWLMYYAAWGGEYLSNMNFRKKWCTTMAVSRDAGATWQRSGKPLLQLGRDGACDQHGTGSCSVLKVGDEYWMWYTAIFQPRADFYRISTALAISRDGGYTFTPHPAGAVLNIPPRIGAPGSTSSKPFVEYRDGKFRMWYSCAVDGAHYRIHYAESDDGICFRWHPDPVLDVSSAGWDSEMTCYPSLVRLPDRTLMFYAGNNYGGIGVAQSDAGV